MIDGGLHGFGWQFIAGLFVAALRSECASTGVRVRRISRLFAVTTLLATDAAAAQSALVV
jgi:hypothetical protein